MRVGVGGRLNREGSVCIYTHTHTHTHIYIYIYTHTLTADDVVWQKSIQHCKATVHQLNFFFKFKSSEINSSGIIHIYLDSACMEIAKLRHQSTDLL